PNDGIDQDCDGSDLVEPANDNCSSAISLEFDELFNADATGATQENIVACGSAMATDGVWFTLQGTGNKVTIDATSSTWNSEIMAFSGSCDSFACEGSIDANNGTGKESLTIPTVNGVMYYINLGSADETSNHDEGAYSILLSEENLSTIEVNTKTSVQLYPNPVADIIYLKNVNSVNYTHAVVYSMEGAIAGEYNVVNNQLNVGDLIPATYVIIISDNNNHVIKRKLIKQ
ncbi:MAG: T9SS type A sorting domain-containing protein, partial [Weeksellaceae bacterium]